MEYNKLETVFCDHIISLIGPTEERDKTREKILEVIKKIIISTFEKENTHLIPHVICFGSFAYKTYLQDSDLDITIMFEDKLTKTIIPNSSFEILNKALSTIRNAFDMYNKEVNNSFCDINIIFAEVRLIKCKFDNTPVDISLNNFAGVSKVMLFDHVEKFIVNKIKDKFLFKRSLILIKAWCYYEGNILGSNVGLMASYALEVLVVYMFNNSHEFFQSELEAFFAFFKMIGLIDWDNNALNIFGTVSTSLLEMNYGSYLPWYVHDKDTDHAIYQSEFMEFIKSVEKFYVIENTKSFQLRNFNIIDPLCANNNLGKSINVHNYSKIKKVFELTYSDIQNILVIKKENDACNYLNSLLILFQKTFTANSPELFLNSLLTPKIIILPIRKSLDKDESSEDNFNFLSTGFNSSLDKNLVAKFNKLFLESKGIELIKESKKYNMITRDILETLLTKLEQVWTNNCYFFPNLYEIFKLTEVLSKYK